MTNPSRAMAETASSAVHEGYWSETGAGPAASQRHAVVGGVGGRWGLEGYPGAPRCSTWCRPPAARPTSRRAPGTMRACRQPSCGRSPRAHRRCTPSPSAAASRPCRRRAYWRLAGTRAGQWVSVTPLVARRHRRWRRVRREAARRRCRRRSADTPLERALSLLSSPVEHDRPPDCSYCAGQKIHAKNWRKRSVRGGGVRGVRELRLRGSKPPEELAWPSATARAPPSP